jgi:signal transduction histidine kinase
MSIPRRISLRDGVTGEFHVWVADTLLAVSVAVVSVVFSTVADPALSLVGLVLSASLAIRRSCPALALAVGMSAAAAYALLSTGPPVSAVVVPVLVYSLARWSGRTLAWTALGVALLGAVAGPVRWMTPQAEPRSANDILITVAAYAGVVVVAYVVGQRGRERAEAQIQREHERAERQRLELAEQERTARAAAAEERNEIAREVHDIVAHSLSMIAVQAEGGSALVARNPESAAEILSGIADESRKALNEIRDMVSFLRRGGFPGGSWPENYRPAPGFADIWELLDRLGGRAHLRVVGRERAIGAVMSFTIYRVVQESLTNFLRHAGSSAKVDVIVTFRDDTMDVIVRDDGRGATAATDGRGHGLHTMRERVLAHGGTMTARPVTGGGFEVHVILPLPSPARNEDRDQDRPGRTEQRT